MGTVTKGIDARLVDRPFFVFDFRALWRSTLALNPERQSARKSKTKKWWVSQPGIAFLNYSVAVLGTVS